MRKKDFQNQKQTMTYVYEQSFWLLKDEPKNGPYHFFNSDFRKKVFSVYSSTIIYIQGINKL